MIQRCRIVFSAWKRLLFFLAFLLSSPAWLQAQDNSGLSGTVTDSLTGETLPGVSVMIKGTQQGTNTDLEGNFILDISGEQATLVFSFVGYKDKEMLVRKGQPVTIMLASNVEALDEVAVVAFGTQKKSSMVSSVTTINPEELKVPSSNLTTALAGRLSGVIAYQRTGEPGQDNASFFIRGVTTFGYKKDPLILIDGIELSATDLARLQPDDIATFSIMKDATATSLYGARGANGVILVTTKEGKEGAARVSLRLENSISSNTQNIELADPITYMLLHNESVLTRDPIGLLPYSQNKIDNTIAGTDPYAYPAIDWRSMLLKNTTSNQRANFSVSGGGKVARYYIAGTFNQDNGILDVDKRNNFNSNIDLKSYLLRSNVNIDLTKTTETIVRLYGSFDDYRGPVDGGDGLYRKIMRSNPVLFPAYFPEGASRTRVKHILFGNSNQGSGNFLNPYADMVKGYKDWTRSNMMAQFELKQDFGWVVPGLSARAMGNAQRYSYYDVSRFYNPYYYQAGGYDPQTGSYSLALMNEGQATEYLGYDEGAKDITATVYIEAAVNYNRTFAENHDVSGMFVYIRRNSLVANAGDLQRSLPFRNEGLSGRFTYGYDDRYLAEFTFGYNGSERFHKSERFGFFPSVGLGWYISNEKFWEPMISSIHKLKLRATYGLVGNDAIGGPEDRFFYLSNVNLNDANNQARFGTNFNYIRPGVTIGRYPNEAITWETDKQLNLGVELGLFNDFEIIAEYFSRDRSNILMTRSSIPTSMGLQADVKANVGQARSSGVDFSLDYNKVFNQGLWLQGRVNFTYAASEFTAYEEPDYREKYKSHLGHSLSQHWGLIAERLFVDDYEVLNSPRQNYGEYMGGDIKYHDVNGDGQITDLDQVPLGFPTDPEIIYGFGFSAGYKGFDFSAFLQGSGRSSFWIDPYATAPFVAYRYSNDELPGYSLQNQLLQAYADDHWSEDNRNLHALWPRLSSTVINNNVQRSSWFMRNGSFLRLKSVELGYSIPERHIERWKITDVRVYLSGTNLMTFSKFKLWDPEMAGNGLSYPIQKVFNIGLQVGF
ncbi:TonB-linked SusC/RagA family outer membrane protein [Anseongella ginsenosidimutans]|uniref:TonB-linked SusC/RagA family outer membrane protein n=1 Tax=Anseongella ginsenosidimutans TaxID=496056 RepID=A0A4R3KWU5_9SPHI|nr:TonB-dependent receptor [Anseongella ginsenosidimutans]QEC51073.1 TonB-dependent receptor [Anseongella ginsenosidimutans]TCS90269.1 TonB-linked SusC/RagA family outer membrane protein [Anseongella ginsenosidimutans]